MKIQRQLRHSAKGGFSLAELMVVIVIIGLLATAVVPNLLKKLNSASTGTAKASLSQIQSAAEQYYYDFGKWPDSLEQLVQKDADGQAYLKQTNVPKDPWGNPFLYDPPRPGEGSPNFYTYGADGAPGGEGKNADITYQDVIDGKVGG